MAGISWLVDGNRIATKIKSASGASDPQEANWKSNPTKACPNCQCTIDNSDTAQEWPGLPCGVKFDPTDQEIICHLLAKVGDESLQPHPFIDEFIQTVNEDDGICYTHPQNLPGVKQDGSVSHFFHRAIKAYSTGTRKRRKIQGDSFADVRWHKTGRTKPVLLDGVQRGCKKIMVLYVSPARGGKSEKTSWVMHQYHLGTQEDEREGEYVISKVFYQQPQLKPSEKNELELPEDADLMIVRVDPVTPKSVTPEPPSTERRFLNYDAGQELIDPSAQCHDMGYMEDEGEAQHKKVDSEDAVQELIDPSAQHHDEGYMEDEGEAQQKKLDSGDHLILKDQTDQMEEKNEYDNGEEQKWWDSESQYLLDSQQLVEGLSLCDELLQSQSPNRDGNRTDQELKNKPRLSDYAQLGTEHWKKDLEECQNLVLDPLNTDNDAADFHLSQIEFGSQDSYISWGGNKLSFEAGDQGS